MDRSTCVTCKGLGSSNLTINPNQDSPKKKRKVLYNLGNYHFTVSSDEAATAIIKRHFPQIEELTTLRSEEFKPGKFGVCKIPEINLSSVPTVAEPKLFKCQVNAKGAPQNLRKLTIGVKKEIPEMAVCDGIDDYFSKLNEDVFIVYNQDLAHKDRPGFSEKDAIVVNLTRGYILVIEAKWHLSASQIKKGVDQLKDAVKTICQSVPILKQKWTLLKVLYGNTIESYDYFCHKCREFVITNYHGTFESYLTALIEKEIPTRTKDFSYVQDFYNIVKAIIPIKLRIAGNVSNFMEISMPKKILQQISENVEEAGTPENIAFWSPDQFNIASNCLDYKRVLFMPQKAGFSTGKSVLMVYCAKQLSKNPNNKILFVSANSEYLANSQGECSLQLYRLNQMFKNYENVQLKACNIDAIDGSDLSRDEFGHELRTKFSDYHVFIDELQTSINTDESIYKCLIDWSKLINPDKHFWVVSYDVKDFNEEKMRTHFPVMPTLKYPLRNTKQIVEFVKLRMEPRKLFYSCFGDSDGKKRSLDVLSIPSNLTRTYDPKEFSAVNFREGFFKALNALEKFEDEEFEGSEKSVIFVLDHLLCTNPTRLCEKCYEKSEGTSLGAWQYKFHIKWIYDNMQRYNKFIQNLKCEAHTGNEGENFSEELDSDLKANSWIQNNPNIDVITRLDMIDGISHDVVVVFMEDDPKKFEYNACLRSKCILIIVYIKKDIYEKFCFCGKCLNCKALTNLRCSKCDDHNAYFCSDQCYQDYQHENECEEGNFFEWPVKLIKFHPGKINRQFNPVNHQGI